MIISNDNLSADGFTVTPVQIGKGVLPQWGNDLCLRRLFQYSPRPEFVGAIPHLDDFSNGPDIDVGGMQIKKSGSNIILVPKELSPFFGTIMACVNNEYRIDPNVIERKFMITITRSDVIAGQAHRCTYGAGAWHVHLPSVHFYRAEKIPVTRIYTAADFYGTECLVGPRSTLEKRPVPDNLIEIISAGKIGVFTSFTIHRSPAPPIIGRRTVFLFSSRSAKSEENIFGNPMSSRLFGLDNENCQTLIERWREAEIAVNARMNPSVPNRMSSPGAIGVAARI